MFEAFHREPRQRQKLEGFRIGTLVGYTPSPLVEDFRALRQEIADEGLFEVRRETGGGGGRCTAEQAVMTVWLRDSAMG